LYAILIASVITVIFTITVTTVAQQSEFGAKPVSDVKSFWISL